ncbi:5-formyltetrahydrofolate cyclo-ligase family protein [Candidatus Hepatincolaceae symbiont of Richtersius coronifer]
MMRKLLLDHCNSTIELTNTVEHQRLNKCSVREKKQIILKAYRPDYSLLNTQLLSNFKKLWQTLHLNVHATTTAAGFYPIKHEANCLPILAYLRTQKLSVALPSVQDTLVLKFKSYNPTDELIEGAFGIKEPNHEKFHLPQIIIAPLLAFDKQGNRLGYGKGYYDHTLHYYNSINHKVVYIGLAYEIQNYSKYFHYLPVDSKDIPLNYVVTEKDFISF